ncbi:MAG: hypothetical protein AAGA48_15430 [Myxococcota bacterium]
MATLTKITKFRRKLRRKKMGRDRKARARNQGTTPSFPVHTPAADANAPAAQLSPATTDTSES